MLRLKEILVKKQLSQAELSRAMGTSTVTISAWATGKAMPSVESLIRICEILEVSLDELVILKKSRKSRYNTFKHFKN
jgi:transcriptional regulator with XRE-family HTH domain